MRKENTFDLTKIREKLEGQSGPQFWKSLEEVAGTEEFQEFLKHEYPYDAANFETPLSRREFLKYMGASLAMAGLAGCSPAPIEKIVAYHGSHKGIVPGKPLYFATGMIWNQHAVGLLVESNMGRPTKVEGNALHPDSLGATHAFHQASILGLYDPDRSKVMIQNGRYSTWDKFVQDLGREITNLNASGGAGLRLLMEPVISPTLSRQLTELQKKFPKSKFYQYDATWPSDARRKAQKATLGEYADSKYHFKKADIIVSLDSDFLVNLPGSLSYARDFISRRQPEIAQNNLSRLYVLESSPTLAGAMADHRLPLSSAAIEACAVEIARRLGVVVEGKFDKSPIEENADLFAALIDDLRSHKGRSLVVPGEGQSGLVHALCYSINEALGNAGETVDYIEPVELHPTEHFASLSDLAQDIAAGQTDLLIVLGANPVYHAPHDLILGERIKNVRKVIHLGLYQDETAALSHWHIPQTHYLEVFSDARASDGTVTLIQPLIAPLYSGKSEHEILSLLLEKPAQTTHEILEQTWKGKIDLNKAIHDGLIPGSASKVKPLKAKQSLNRADLKTFSYFSSETPASLTVVFRPDPSVWDGRFSNNGWLQETPKPLSKLTWENAIYISPRDAENLGISNGDGLKIIAASGNSLEGPAWIMPGHAKGSLTLFLGYGRNFQGKIGNGIGFDVNVLRNSVSPFYNPEIKVEKTGRKYPLASTQHHHNMEGRELVKTAIYDDFKHHPDFAKGHHHAGGLLSLYPEHPYPDNKWGMVINLNSCFGCNSCVLACQSENNSPVVGKEEVMMGREMQWIRIDHYYEGNLDNPATHHQPVLCMHCENAPCEPVCPVGATVHSDEGLNEMVYNRCVGTKYCSNNCPYKVRRFNFFEYADNHSESLKLMRNPEVTIRSRGVMEKCTFCVQRISAARIEAAKENRPIKDGEVVTACQAACPTSAISFGNLNDPQAAVTQHQSSPLNYGLLSELNTRPRVSYLAHVVNPNPKLVI